LGELDDSNNADSETASVHEDTPERPLKKDVDARHKAGHDGRAVPKPGRLAANGVSQVQRNLIANHGG
jgi:hypothetical protein